MLPAQHGWKTPPHGTQTSWTGGPKHTSKVDPAQPKSSSKQTNPRPHGVAPGQHGWKGPPQGVHVPKIQPRPGPAQEFPSQHGWPGAPQGVGVVVGVSVSVGVAVGVSVAVAVGVSVGVATGAQRKLLSQFPLMQSQSFSQKLPLGQPFPQLPGMQTTPASVIP